jgi:hypothetical protein
LFNLWAQQNQNEFPIPWFQAAYFSLSAVRAPHGWRCIRFVANVVATKNNVIFSFSLLLLHGYFSRKPQFWKGMVDWCLFGTT